MTGFEKGINNKIKYSNKFYYIYTRYVLILFFLGKSGGMPHPKIFGVIAH